MAKIYLDSGDTSFNISNSNTTVYGQAGTEQIVIDLGVTGVVTDQNVERVDLAGTPASFTYQQAGNAMLVYSGTTLVATIPLQIDTNGTQIVFTSGSVEAKLVAGVMTLGGAAVPAAAAAVVPTTINPFIVSESVTTPVVTTPTFSVAATAASVTEGGSATFTVSLSSAQSTATTVAYTLAGTGTAALGTDTTTVANATLTFAAGEVSKTVTVPVTFDSVVETGEGMTLTLSAPSTGTVLSTSAAAAAVAFADPVAPTFTMTSNAVAGAANAEGTTITYTITPGSITDKAYTFTLSTIGDTVGGVATAAAAADFSPASQTITFAAGTTTAQTVVQTIVSDSATEGLEGYKTSLLDSTFAVVASATGLITDGTVAGTPFTLTTGVDTITGTASDDIFIGISGTGATTSVADTINGLGGTDTFKAYTDGTVTLPTMTSIEHLFVNDSTAHESRDLTAATLVSAGVTSLTLQNGTTIDGSTVTVTMGAGQSTLVLDGITDGDAGAATVADGGIAWTTAAATTSGSLTVNNVGATGVNTALTVGVTTAGMATLNLVATGTNFINLLNAGAGITRLNISGAGSVNNFTALAAGIVTVDASTATGAQTMDFTTAAVRTVTGGTGADTFTFGATFVGAENATVASRDTINGGAGRDTLSITSAIAANTAATSVAQTTVTNVEIITISDASGANVDLTKFVGADTLKFGSTVGAFTYTFNSGSIVEYITGDAGNAARSYIVGGTGTSDSLTLATVAATDTGTGLQTFTGIETLNISTGTTAGAAVEIGGALTITPTAGVAGGDIVATGVNALTFTGVVTAKSIDASALTGIVTMSAAIANASTIKGGTKADVLLGSTGNDSITGGEGADTITAGAGSDSIILTETTSAIDKVVFSGVAVADGATASTQVTANGVDVITGFGTNDTINVAALGDGTTPSGLTAITAAGVQAALTTDRSIVVSATGAAASLTTLGTATVTDFTNMTQVSAYLTERFTVTSAAQHDVIVFNNTSGSNDTSYVYTVSNVGADTTIDAADIFLIGTITHTAGTALTAANVVYA